MSVTTPKIYLTRNIDGLEYVLKSIHEEYVKTGDRNIEDLLGEISILEGFLNSKNDIIMSLEKELGMAKDQEGEVVKLLKQIQYAIRPWTDIDSLLDSDIAIEDFLAKLKTTAIKPGGDIYGK